MFATSNLSDLVDDIKNISEMKIDKKNKIIKSKKFIIEIQSYLLPKHTYSLSKAIKWAKDKKINWRNMKTSKNYYEIRQKPTNKFKKFKVLPIGGGKKIIFGMNPKK